jgi:hypothetical protein
MYLGLKGLRRHAAESQPMPVLKIAAGSFRQLPGTGNREITPNSPGQTADAGGGMAEDDSVALELMLNRFRRLVRELQRGTITRTDFQPWEVEILLDIESCQLERGRREETLRRYQQAVERQLETSPGPPMKLSEFLKLRAQRHE